MATKSIYVDVKVKKRDDCRKLISALEKTKNHKITPVNYSRPVKVLNGEQIKEIFDK